MATAATAAAAAAAEAAAVPPPAQGDDASPPQPPQAATRKRGRAAGEETSEDGGGGDGRGAAAAAGRRFEGRVALVTGGGGGIGRAAAVAFVCEGAKVVVADIDLKLAEETCVQILGGSGADAGRMRPTNQAAAFRCDVAVREDVKALVAFAVAQFGAIHHCFNNAGIEGKRAALHETAAEDFGRVLAVNAGGVFHCMAEEIAQMLSQLAASTSANSGDADPPPSPSPSPYAPKAIDSAGLTIVNTSSTAGQAAMPEFSPYCASKHAVIGLTRCAAKEYASKGIRVNCICPSTTATPMVERFAAQWPDWQAKQNASFPTGRVATADEVAQAVLWLSSSACPMVCGACLGIDGALTA